MVDFYVEDEQSQKGNDAMEKGAEEIHVILDVHWVISEI